MALGARAQPRSPIPGRRVLVLLLDRVHLQDLAGPVQVLHEASAVGGAYRLSFCGLAPSVRSAQGLVLSELAPLPDPVAGDLVLVPGVALAALDLLQLPRAWLRRAHAAGARLASICTGAFVLARAGLLDGRRCTTHWMVTRRLAREHPRACVMENRLFVQDGGVMTSAGIASGIDMALSLVEQDYGPLVVSRVARVMVVYLRRSGEQGQQSVYLDHRTHLHPGIHRVQDFLVEHPERRPTADELARIALMSPRNFRRVFRKATGITPNEFAARVKVQVARDLLDDPQRTVDGIAASCGFESSRQLRRLWRKSYGVSIAAFRRARADHGRRDP